MTVTDNKVRAVARETFVIPRSIGTGRNSANSRDAQAIIDSIADFYGVWDVSSPELCFSDRWLASLGYSPADLSHQQGFFEQFIHPDDITVFETELKAHLAGKAQIWNCECRIRTKAGAYRWFEIRGKAAPSRGRGAGVQLVGVVLDIDARKHQKNVTERPDLELALRQSEEKFSKAFLQGPLALTLTSAVDYRYLEVNEMFERYTGYRRDEVIGRSVNELGLWLENDRRGELIEELKSTGGYRIMAINFRTKSGEIRSGLGSAVLIELGGELCMLSMIMDVTEQKAAVEALRESEERLRIAIASGRMYAFEWDLETDSVSRSPQATEILGLRLDNSPPTKQQLIDMMIPEDREQYLHLIDSLTAGDPHYKMTFRISRADGSMIWLQESGRAFFTAEGKIRKIVGISSDVTEIRESERTLRDLSQRLISSQEEERRRIARELHDNIGQRLALLCIQAQRLDSGEAAEDHTEQNSVHKLYQRVKEIARDISNLSHRLHSSELNFLGLGVAAERLCRDFQSQYGIDVSFTIKKLPPKLDNGKSLCFYRVLQEALQNVARHSEANRVIVDLQSRKGKLILKISDNGKGFEPATAVSGSGLGLLSVRERLNLVGGEFTLASKPGFGTTLIAAVPIDEAIDD